MARFRILSSRLPEGKMIRWQDLGSHPVNFLKERWSDDKIQDLVKSTSWRRDDQMKRFRISASRLHERKMIRWQDSGSCHLVISPSRSRLSWILSFDHISFKTTWRDSRSCHLIISPPGSRLDEIRDLVIWSSLLMEVDLMRSEILSSDHLSFRMWTWWDPDSWADHLSFMKSTWWDPRSCHLIIYPPGSRLDEILNLAIWSSFFHEVNLLRSWILSSDHLSFMKSTWWDPRSCHLIISPSLLLQEEDLMRSEI